MDSAPVIQGGPVVAFIEATRADGTLLSPGPGNGTMPIVSAATHNENRRDGAIRTLGDLLYADRGKNRVPEREWVDLIQSIAAGDQLALRALFERTHRLVFTLIMRITGQRQTAEELTLDVFHDVWRRAANYDSQNGTVLGWIMSQARSRAIDRVRSQQRRKRVTPIPGESAALASQDDPQIAVELHVESRRLEAALSALTPEERLAIETAFFSELTYAETSIRLNEPLGTIKSRIRSGLEKLRSAFETATREL
jgi:RNA polymerase sigma-70 factor, ECF subfamily